jgi:hypothetical protein
VIHDGGCGSVGSFDTDRAGVGDPDANTENVEATPAVTVSVKLPVKTGGAGAAGE